VKTVVRALTIEVQDRKAVQDQPVKTAVHALTIEVQDRKAVQGL
jgi:hypothetical protein